MTVVPKPRLKSTFFTLSVSGAHNLNSRMGWVRYISVPFLEMFPLTHFYTVRSLPEPFIPLLTFFTHIHGVLCSEWKRSTRILIIHRLGKWKGYDKQQIWSYGNRGDFGGLGRITGASENPLAAMVGHGKASTELHKPG